MVFLRSVFFLLIIFSQANMAMAQSVAPEWTRKVGARKMPNATAVFSVNDFGAVADASSVCTSSIQKAIDACAKKGGGVVVFKPGTYVSGSIFLKDNVHLRIDENVTILGSQDFSDYPDISTRIAGIEMVWPAALINAMKVKNVAITGKGTINARGKFCWDKYWAMRKDYDKKGLRWIVDYDAKRVRTLLVQEAEDITVKGLTFKNAGFWTVQLLYSSHLTVDGITIKNNEDGSGPSTDGIDVDSSSWTLIENCDIDCNDDNFCLKAGRDWDGLRVNRPTEYVVIRKSIARRGAGLLTLGSETSGGIRHVYASQLSAKHTDNGLRIKSATTRGGTIEDIQFVDSKLDSVINAYQFNLNWYPAYSYSTLPDGYTMETIPAHWKSMLQKVSPVEKGIPQAKNITIKNVSITNAVKAFEINGLPNSLLEGFSFQNAFVSAQTLGTMEYTKDWKFTGTRFDISNRPVELKKASNMAEEERLKQ